MNKSWREKTIYILKKLLQMAIVLILLSTIVFVIARLCPGDPLKAYYGDGAEHMSQVQREAAREKLGLDDSMPVQYARWAAHLFDGDLGLSYKYKQPVTEVIGKVWVNTLILGGVSLRADLWPCHFAGALLRAAGGQPPGQDHLQSGRNLRQRAVLFPGAPADSGFRRESEAAACQRRVLLRERRQLFDRAYHLVLPTAVMVLEHLWYYAYMVRNKLSQETREDYVLLCKAEGISRRKILCRHCLRNIMPSMLVIMAISVPHILGGTYVVETVFSYPGLGTLSFEAAMYQDYNMLMALCLLTGAVVLVFNLLAQIVSEFIDPRMRLVKNVRRRHR